MFLDPYGMQVDWATIEAIAKTKAIDLWILFPLGHIFQVLTKRSERLREFAPFLPWPKNVWIGVSVEDERVVGRINDLTEIPAAVRFLSCEPLIGPLRSLPLAAIDWVIVGGESGPGARQMEGEWVEDIFRQCRAADVPFFFKQWGGVRKSRAGRTLHDRTYDEYPSSHHSAVAPA